MNTQQFEQLLNKLEIYNKTRNKQQQNNLSQRKNLNDDGNHSGSPEKKLKLEIKLLENVERDKNRSDNPSKGRNKYSNLSYKKFQVLTTLGTFLLSGAGTFGRVKQVRIIGDPSHQVFALKIIPKAHIINLKQVDHIKLQKKILMQLNHPFIYSLYLFLYRKTSFQDNRNVYMLFQYLSGGQLFNRLRKDGRFSNDISLFYTCQILLALSYMHSKNIVYRDLKPQNLLIDKQGHMKIADFGFAKKLHNQKTYTLCGTPQYLAPQIIHGSKEGYGKSADWWALGVLIYELLTGHPPFYDIKPLGIYQKILKGVIEFPIFLSVRSKDIIRKLLNPEIKYRLGCVDVYQDNQNGQSIKKHKWFKGVDWMVVINRRIPAPWIPILQDQSDSRWFDKVPQSPRNHIQLISEEQQKIFSDF